MTQEIVKNHHFIIMKNDFLKSIFEQMMLGRGEERHESTNSWDWKVERRKGISSIFFDLSILNSKQEGNNRKSNCGALNRIWNKTKMTIKPVRLLGIDHKFTFKRNLGS